MRKFRGRAIAAGILCAIAATVAVWSGPLAAASADLRAAGGTTTSRPAGSTHVASATPQASPIVTR